jgi:hypothetical protein
VLVETGYRAQILRLFKIITRGDFPKQTVRFVFGCQIEPIQLQDPQLELATFSPDSILTLAQKDAFDDPVLIKLVYDFKNHIPSPVSDSEEALLV